MRGSHAHHVPQAMRPHSGPVISTTVVKITPSSAAATEMASSRSSRSQR